ncbi:MAG: efflux RND transporter periplasmic adaptor subunit [Chloroflexi bacterium]|nr:efflux RND transporter periplasmic adaptor subunit [Chloroflexota bacterium]
MNRKRIALYAVLSLLPLLAALWIAGVDPNYILGNYVTTSSAFVTGNLIEASAPASGEVTRIVSSVGDPVHPGQIVAYLTTLPQPDRQLPVVPQVRAPAAGTIVHLSVLVGQRVAVGDPVAMIADLQQLWVIAGIDEGSFHAVHIGQRADVYLPALDRTFPGRVTQLSPDLSASAPRSGGTAASGTASTFRQNNQVPVRIDFDYGDALVYPGMSANVTIYVRG